MIKLFISYRREDTLAICGRISDRLKRRFGRASVLMDITTIPVGVDFRDFIAETIKEIDVLLVVVGRKWLEDSSTKGNRLFADNDTLRMELEIAFSSGTPIIPLLIGEAKQPSEEDLPHSLQFLPSLNSLRIDEGRDFDHHLEQLIGRIDEIVRSKIALHQARLSIDAPERALVLHERTDALGKQPSLPDPQFSFGRTLHISGTATFAIVASLLLLNSLLAALGSVLWARLPFWPAYMVVTIACGFLGWWGVAIAALAPLLSATLHIGGAPTFFYIPVDVIQAITIVLAYKVLKIHSTLDTWIERAKYIGGVAIIPSVTGAALAWFLRKAFSLGANDPGIFEYTFFWAVENTLSCIFPGIWLYNIVGSFSKPFSWAREGYRGTSFGGRVETAIPSALTLFMGMTLPIALVGALSSQDPAHPWENAKAFVGAHPVFGWLVLATMLTTLVALGFSLRHIRRSWLLDEAIKRYARTPIEAKRLLEGRQGEAGRRPAVLIAFEIINFGAVSQQLPPKQLTNWINLIIDTIVVDLNKYDCEFVRLTVPLATVMRGLDDPDSDPRSVFAYAFDVFARQEELNAALQKNGLPPVVIGCGMHSGIVAFGDIAIGQSVRSFILGEPLNVAADMAKRAKEATVGNLPLLISSSCIRDSGFSAVHPNSIGLANAHRLRESDTDLLQFYEIVDFELFRATLSNREVPTIRGASNLHANNAIGIA